MSWKNKSAGEAGDPMVEQALRNFKASVDAWSDAAYSRPRAAATTGVRSAGWRLAASWALGCVLAAGAVAGTIYERHHTQELAKIAAIKAAQKAAEQRAAAAQAAPASAMPEDAELLANVDSAVSQQVPTAMEPLAQMMDDDGTK